MGCCGKTIGKVLFRTGQLLLLAGAVCYVVSLSTANWVVRPSINSENGEINLTKTKVVLKFGIFHACRQIVASTEDGDSDDCGDIADNISSVSVHAVKYVQFVMIVAGILYGTSLVLEILQVIPMKKYPNFIAENRMVEMFSSIATVLILQGILIFAGEIKNKAQRVSGQENERSGWSFVVALIGLLLSVVGLLLITMFRVLPFPAPGLKGGSWISKTESAQSKDTN